MAIIRRLIERWLAFPPHPRPQSGGESADGKSLRHTFKVGTYFALWYALNIGYNVYNKKALNAMPMPWTVASVQLLAGIPYVAALWVTGLRIAPKLSAENVKNLAPSALCHLATHVGAVLSLGAGAVSFTHIVKASEPVVSAALSAVFLREFLPLPVYLSLLPVIGGVGLASLKELSFSWLAFGAAMLSNVASASRAILSKVLTTAAHRGGRNRPLAGKAPSPPCTPPHGSPPTFCALPPLAALCQTVMSGKPVGENLNAANLYAVLTIIAFAMLAPVSLLVEPPTAVRAAWGAAVAGGTSAAELGRHIGLSGVFYYLYNEVAFLALSEVAPVTHAVGNTIKRVVIIFASVVVFKNPLTGLGALGSAIAVLGCASPVFLHAFPGAPYASARAHASSEHSFTR